MLPNRLHVLLILAAFGALLVVCRNVPSYLPESFEQETRVISERRMTAAWDACIAHLTSMDREDLAREMCAHAPGEVSVHRAPHEKVWRGQIGNRWSIRVDYRTLQIEVMSRVEWAPKPNSLRLVVFAFDAPRSVVAKFHIITLGKTIDDP